jgi:selenocysteine lyase/cysteine desulfurase
MDALTAKTQSLTRYLMEVLTTLPQIELLNEKSRYAGHVAIRILPQKKGCLTTAEFRHELFTNQKVYCDYAMRYDLVRFGVGSLFTSHEDIYKLYRAIRRVLDEKCPAVLGKL